MATVAITAVEVTGWAARLVVTVSGATVGATLTATRDGSPVLGGVGLPAASTVLHDAAPPLNRRLSWTAALSTGESATAVLPGIKSRRTIVSSPHRGLIAECTAAEQGQTQHEARVAVIPIENSPRLTLSMRWRALLGRCWYDTHARRCVTRGCGKPGRGEARRTIPTTG